MDQQTIDDVQADILEASIKARRPDIIYVTCRCGNERAEGFYCIKCGYVPLKEER